MPRSGTHEHFDPNSCVSLDGHQSNWPEMQWPMHEVSVNIRLNEIAKLQLLAQNSLPLYTWRLIFRSNEKMKSHPFFFFVWFFSTEMITKCELSMFSRNATSLHRYQQAFFFFYGPASCMHWEEQLNLYGCLVCTNTKRCVTPLCTNGAQVNDNRRPCDSRVRHFEYLAGIVKAVMFKIHEWRMRKKIFRHGIESGRKRKVSSHFQVIMMICIMSNRTFHSRGHFEHVTRLTLTYIFLNTSILFLAAKMYFE